MVNSFIVLGTFLCPGSTHVSTNMKRHDRELGEEEEEREEAAAYESHEHVLEATDRNLEHRRLWQSLRGVP